jgi:putative PIN family toxin of toxin-antitoxin system
MRVVPDTNVLISALMFAGLPGVFLQLGLERRFTLITSNALLSEFEEKLVAKFRVTEQDARAVRLKIAAVAEVIQPEFTLHAVQDDPDDNRVIECAVAGKADYIVSGDRHLLQLAQHEGVEIMNVRQFLAKAGFLA